MTGALFGLFAFMPLIRRVVPDEGSRPASAREAFFGTFLVIAFVIGAIVAVFYSEQIVTEIIVAVAIAGTDAPGALPWRAVGRFLTFLVFDVVFALGVATAVWREYRRHPA